MRRFVNKIHLKFAQLRQWIYLQLGLTDYTICECCLGMFDTRKGYGAWQDITSCPACGPTEEDLIDAQNHGA